MCKQLRYPCDALIVTNKNNAAPHITSYYPIGNPIIQEGEIRLFNISYEDADNNPLMVYWYLNDSLISTLNDNASIYKSNYTFISNYSSAGNYIIVVNVSDGTYYDTHTWILRVFNTNRPPYFNRTIQNQTWPENTALYGLDLDDYAVECDPEDILSYSVNFLSNPHSISVSINSNNVVTFSQP